MRTRILTCALIACTLTLTKAFQSHGHTAVHTHTCVHTRDGGIGASLERTGVVVQANGGESGSDFNHLTLNRIRECAVVHKSELISLVSSAHIFTRKGKRKVYDLINQLVMANPVYSPVKSTLIDGHWGARWPSAHHTLTINATQRTSTPTFTRTRALTKLINVDTSFSVKPVGANVLKCTNMLSGCTLSVFGVRVPVPSTSFDVVRVLYLDSDLLILTYDDNAPRIYIRRERVVEEEEDPMKQSFVVRDGVISSPYLAPVRGTPKLNSEGEDDDDQQGQSQSRGGEGALQRPTQSGGSAQTEFQGAPLPQQQSVKFQSPLRLRQRVKAFFLNLVDMVKGDGGGGGGGEGGETTDGARKGMIGEVDWREDGKTESPFVTDEDLLEKLRRDQGGELNSNLVVRDLLEGKVRPRSVQAPTSTPLGPRRQHGATDGGDSGTGEDDLLAL